MKIVHIYNQCYAVLIFAYSVNEKCKLGNKCTNGPTSGHRDSFHHASIYVCCVDSRSIYDPLSWTGKMLCLQTFKDLGSSPRSHIKLGVVTDTFETTTEEVETHTHPWGSLGSLAQWVSSRLTREHVSKLR